jgi:hypothetical protein
MDGDGATATSFMTTTVPSSQPEIKGSATDHYADDSFSWTSIDAMTAHRRGLDVLLKARNQWFATSFTRPSAIGATTWVIQTVEMAHRP